MADFIKKRTDNQDSNIKSIRELNNARDLMAGDFVKFKLHAPPLIKDKTFKVTSINTYNFESSMDTEFVLKGTSRSPIHMSIENNSESTEIRLSVILDHDIVTKLFDENEIAAVIDLENELVEMRRLVDTDAVNSKLSEYAGWTAPHYYRQAFAVRGYYYKGDYRQKPISKFDQNFDEFDYYCLVSNDEIHVIEIAVYDATEEVMLTFVTDDKIFEDLQKGS